MPRLADGNFHFGIRTSLRTTPEKSMRTQSCRTKHYLKAYNLADAEAIKLRTAADSIERVAHALRAGSQIACTEALPEYPTASQICTLLSSLEQAKTRLHQLWNAVPTEMRQRLPEPSRAVRPRTDVAFVGE